MPEQKKDVNHSLFLAEEQGQPCCAHPRFGNGNGKKKLIETVGGCGEYAGVC